MRFSGIPPAETPQPIKMKFCMIDYVGELTWCANNGCNRLAGDGPTDRWNITSIFVLYFTLLYFTLLYLTLPFFSCMPLQPKRLNRFARTIAQTTRFAARKCPLGSRWYEITFRGQNPPKTPNFGTGMPNFQPNQYSRITFERWEIDEKFQRSAYTKSGSENRTVMLFFLSDAT